MEAGKFLGPNAPNPVAPSQNGKEKGKDIFMMSGSTLIIDSKEDITLKEIESNNKEGIASDDGGLEKKGEGTLTLKGVNTYTGKTILSAGKLFVEGDTQLTNTDEIVLSGGVFALGGGFVSNKQIQLSNATIEAPDEGTAVFLSGKLSGAESGVFRKKGQGTLVLSYALGGQAANDYAGKTFIDEGKVDIGSSEKPLGTGRLTIGEQGTLRIQNSDRKSKIESLHGAGNIEFGYLPVSRGTLEISSGHFSGSLVTSPATTGRITKTGADKVLTLSGNNSEWDGLLTVSAGTLEIFSDDNLGDEQEDVLFEGNSTLRASGTINKPIRANNGNNTFTVEVIESKNLALSNLHAADTNITKKGSGTCLLLSKDPIDITDTLITVQEGTFGSNPLSAAGTEVPIIVAPEGRLVGNAEYKKIENRGVVKPGFSIGELSCGEYVQKSGATLQIEVSKSGQYSVLKVTGKVTLEDKSHLLFKPDLGIYDPYKEYEFLRKDLQAIEGAGRFSDVHFGPYRLSPADIKYGNEKINLVLPRGLVVLPIDQKQLKGNAKVIANYLFDNIDKLSDELKSVLNTLIAAPAKEMFARNLLKLGPQQLGAVPLVSMQSSVRMGRVMSQIPEEKNFWISPMGYYYKQDEKVTELPFNSRTLGFALGYQKTSPRSVTLGLGVGYTHSNLKWRQNRGSGAIQSVYVAPSLSYIGKYGHGGAIVCAGASLYDIDRNIKFSNFHKKATSNHQSLDLLLGLHGALKLQFPGKFMDRLYFIPSLRLDFVNIFESSYREFKADALNLSIARKSSSFFRPEALLKLMYQFSAKEMLFFPSVYVGWVKEIPLRQERYHMRLQSERLAPESADLTSYHRFKGQIVIGAGWQIQYQDGFSCALGYEANVSGSTYLQEATLNLSWNF